MFEHLNYESNNFLDALDVHHKKNSHHPEYCVSGIHGMSEIDIAEMVCDCLARSQEFGTDIKQWFYVEAPLRYGYKNGDDVWGTIFYFLNIILTPPFK